MNHLISEDNGLKEWHPDKDDNRKLSEIIDLWHTLHGKNLIEETMKYAHFRKTHLQDAVILNPISK
jgi:hypothetical protein